MNGSNTDMSRNTIDYDKDLKEPHRKSTFEEDETHAVDTSCNEGTTASDIADSDDVAEPTGDEKRICQPKFKPEEQIPNCAPAPKIPIKLFVGRIPRSYKEEQIRVMFERYGEVLDIVIMIDRMTQSSKGSAFVRMGSMCQGDFAIKCLNNRMVVAPELGPMIVKYAVGEVEALGLPVNFDPTSFQAKLFVGCLPRSASEDQLRNIFETCGTIEEIFIMKEGSGLGRGCAFVRLRHKEQGVYAVNKLSGKTTVPGACRAIEVRFAELKRNDRYSTMDDRRQQSGNYSNNNNQNSYNNPNNNYNNYNDNNYRHNYNENSRQTSRFEPSMSPEPRQFGPWSEYFNSDGRPYYHNERTGVTQWNPPSEFTDGQEASERFKTERDAFDEPTGPPGANIFVFHIPNEWREDDLYKHFAPYGTVVNARIAQDRYTGRNRGFAFVSYTRPESAEDAIHSLNGYMVDGKRLKVAIKKGDDGNMRNGSANAGQSRVFRPSNYNSGGDNSVGHGGGGPSSRSYPSVQHRYAPY